MTDRLLEHRKRKLASRQRPSFSAGLCQFGVKLSLGQQRDRGPIAVSPETIRAALRRSVPDREQEIMGHLTQPYFAKGLAEGRAEGRAKVLVEGKAEGEASALLRILEKRFGSLPTALRQRVLTSDPASIETWLARAIDRPDIESGFKST